MKEFVADSELSCPECGHKELLTMPTDACQWFYECPACHTLLKPKAGDCCVFCSYGSVACPPIQLQRSGSESLGGCLCD
jgi:hypothetical protein